MPVTLVTETGTGVGFATALQLAKHGHTVVATMRGLARRGRSRRPVSLQLSCTRPGFEAPFVHRISNLVRLALRVTPDTAER